MADYVPLCEYLPYETYDPEQHVWRCRDHLGWVLQVSPQVGWDPQLINSLTHWLVEQCPAEAVLHIQCVALPPADTAFPSCPASLTPDSALYHVLQARAAHLQQGTIVPLAGHSETLRDFHVLISGTLPRKKTALSEAVRFREQVMQTLQAKSVACGVVAINPWLRWLRWYLNPTVSPSLRDAPWCPHTPLAHQVVSPETQWVVTADAIHVQPAHWQIVPLVVSAFPPEWHAGDAMRFLGHVFHSYQQIPGPFCINLVLRAIPKYRAEQTATVKLWKANRYSHPLIRQFIPRLAKEHTDWAAVKQRLDGQDTLVSLQLSVQLWQPAPQMAQAITKTRALFRSQGITLVPERYIQLPQVLGTLPCGHHLGLFERLSRFGRMKTVCASHAASVFPIYGESKGLGQLMYLTGRSGQLMGFDPFANPSSNYNIAITGTSGSGKSVFLQDLVTLSVAGKRHVFVIDIGRSFEALCHSLGGQFIAFDLQSRLSLNPFTHIRDIDVSQSIVMPLLLAMGSPRDPVSRAVESRLEQCVQALWATHGNATTITLIAEKLCADPDRRVADLGQGLYPFTASGRYGRWFEPPCTLCVENPFIVFELEELKDKPDLQSTVFLVLMVHITETMYRSDRSQRVMCVIDEAWDLLDSPQVGGFIEDGYRRARKYNGSLVTGTQCIQDYQRSPASLAAWNNAGIRIFLQQPADAVSQAMDSGFIRVSPYEHKLIDSLHMKPGAYSEAFFMTEGGHFLGRLLLDPLSQTLYSTTAADFAAIRAHVANGVPWLEAVRLRMKQRQAAV